MSDNGILQLVENIYDAAADSEKWVVFLDQWAKRHPGVVTSFLFQDHILPEYHATFANTEVADFMHRYETTYRPYNPYPRHAMTQAVGGIINVDNISDDMRRTNNPFYNELMAQHELVNATGSIIARDESRTMIVSILFPQAYQKNISTGLHHDLKLLIPHLKRSIQIGRAFHAAGIKTRACETALDLFHMGVALFNKSCLCIYHNGIAERLFQGGCLRISRQKLYAKFPHDDQRLQSLLKQTIHSQSISSGGVMRLTDTEGKHIQLLIAPILPSQTGLYPEGSAAMVLIREEAHHYAPQHKHLSTLYGFTGAEASLAVSLLNGDTLQNYADDRNISRETARTHLRNLCQKLGVSRQTDVVRILSSGLAAWIK